MNKTPERACILAFLLIATALQADARQKSGNLTVGTTVQAYAHQSVSQPTQLVITNKDVNLGYVVVPNSSNPGSTQLTIRTNDRAGYTLIFQVAPSEQALFKSIQVTGLGKSVVLSATGGQVTVAYSGATSTFTLSYQFNLAKVLKDGTYAWPLTILARPN